MSIAQKLPNSVYWSHQTCPFCGEDKIVIANGLVWLEEEIKIVPDRGYSFCNCKSIWFTDWSNIDQVVFEDAGVEAKHKKNKDYEKKNKDVFRYMLYKNRIHNLGIGRNRFFDIGSITPFILDEARRLGFKTTGLDMYPRKDFGHKLIVGDVDTINIVDTYDLIWASHIFEHLHYPLKVLKKCYDCLSDGGEMFVAMPDPFFINYDNIYHWTHWQLRTHYIMWDMDSFCNEAEKVGFKIAFKKRNTEVNLLDDMHLVFIK